MQSFFAVAYCISYHLSVLIQCYDRTPVSADAETNFLSLHLLLKRIHWKLQLLEWKRRKTRKNKSFAASQPSAILIPTRHLSKDDLLGKKFVSQFKHLNE